MDDKNLKPKHETVEITDPILENPDADISPSKKQLAQEKFLKNKRYRRTTTMSMVIIFVVFVLGVMVVQIITPSNSLQNNVKTFLSRFGRLDISATYEFVSPDSDDESYKLLSSLFENEYAADFYAAAFAEYTFSVESSTQGDGNGSCIITLNLPDISSAVKNFDILDGISFTPQSREDVLSDNFASEFFPYLTQSVNDGNMPFSEITVTIILKDSPDGWQIVLDSSAVDILSGGLFSALGL